MDDVELISLLVQLVVEVVEAIDGQFWNDLKSLENQAAKKWSFIGEVILYSPVLKSLEQWKSVFLVAASHCLTKLDIGAF